MVQISTGQLLREEIAKKSKVGLEVQPLVEKGEYVSDGIFNF